jgi:hypothetical protein
MREQLHFIDRMDLLLTLQFYNNSILHEQVGPKTTVQFHSIVHEWYSFLSNDHEPLRVEFISKAAFIGGLKKTGAKPTMDFDR